MKRNPATAMAIFLFEFCFFIYLISHSLYSQDISRTKDLDTDSIAALLNGNINTEQIDLQNLLSSAMCMKDTDSSILLATEAIHLSDSLNYKKGLANGYFNMGLNYLVMDSLYPTMVNYLKALRIFEGTGPSIEFAEVYQRLADINIFTDRYEQGINYDLKAIDIYKQLNENKNLPLHYHSITVSLYTMGAYDSAIIYNEIAMAHADSSYLYRYCNNYGRIYGMKYAESGDTVLLNKAIKWSQKGLNSPRIDIHFKAAINLNLHYYYSQYQEKRKDSIGLSYLSKVIPIAKEKKDAFYLIPLVYRYQGKFKSYQKDYDSAIIYYKKTIEIINKALNDFSVKEYSDPMHAWQNRFYIKRYKKYTHFSLYSTYQYLGEHEKASEQLVQYNKSRNEEKSRQNENLITMLEADSENEKIEKQIALLERDKKINELNASKARNLSIGIGSVFVILLLLGILFIRQNKLKNEHKTILLEQKLLRLQMNPHFIFNALSNILNFIDNNQNKKAAGYLTTFSRLLRTTLESTREDMIPFEKEVNSLRNYLELQKLRYGHKFDYAIKVNENIDEEDMAIPPMLVQPFIENAIEHGIRHKTTPGRIDVRFYLKDKKIVCEVEDDGVGREKAWEAEVKDRSGHKSLATEIIKDRIKTLNKKFKQKIKLEIIDIKSESLEALGTKVIIGLPYGNVY